MIKGLQRLTGNTFEDNRGIIHEIFKNFLINSVTHTSSKPNTLRGVHVQEWNKIIYVARGRVLAGFYDPRTKEKMLVAVGAGEAWYVPKGIGNSYLVTGKENAEYFYFNTENYDESKTHTISYKIFDWPGKPIVSKKDKEASI